jgi:hypothetical protein
MNERQASVHWGGRLMSFQGLNVTRTSESDSLVRCS